MGFHGEEASGTRELRKLEEYIYTQQKLWRGAEIELNEFTVCTGYCRGGGELQESKWPPGSSGASVRSGVLILGCCMRGIYTVARVANAGNPSNGHRSSIGRQMSHTRVGGTDERELNTSWDMKIWKEQRKVVKY